MTFTDYCPPSWDVWFLQLVYLVASKSKDPRTKIGAIIVRDNRIISTGYNGLPHGVDDTILARHERPEKYLWYEHGERNSLFNAAKYGINTENASLYTNAMPCADCARGIIQAGIKQIYVHKQFTLLTDSIVRDKWIGHRIATTSMLNEASVEVVEIDAIVGCKAYFDGHVYDL